MLDSLRPHGLQHTRPPHPWPTPRAYSNSCLPHWWCHTIISSSAIPFSSHLHSFPASGYFPMSQFFASGGQTIGVSASASVLPKNTQDWFPLGFPLGLVGSPCSPRDSQESFPTPQFKSINSWVLSFLYSPSLTSIHDYWNNEDLQIEVHAFLSRPETSPSAFSSSTWKCQFSSCSTNSIVDFFISHAIGAVTLPHAPVIFHQDFCSRLPTHLSSPILALL